MLRSYTALAWMAMGLAAASAQAEWPHPIRDFCLEYKRNQCWPEPFLHPDRVLVQAPFETMISNGWRAQNTLADHHFDENGQLTNAGRLKVRDILATTPPQYQTIFVLRPETVEMLPIRIEAVRMAAAQYAIDGNVPDVAESNIRPRGWSANYVDVIGRKFNETTPAPRIPEMERPTNGF